MVTLLLSRIGSLNCQQHVTSGLLDEAHSLIDIGGSLLEEILYSHRDLIRIYLVVDLEDLVILTEPGSLALTSRYDLCYKHSHLEDDDRVRNRGHMRSLITYLILRIAIQTSVDQR